MAKKVKSDARTDNSVRPGYCQHASKRCKETECMGTPKELIVATEFDGTICKKCFAVHEFKKQETVDAQEKLDIKEEKIKKKTIEPSEKELLKAIAEADKIAKKKVKKQTPIQTNLF